MTGHSLYRVAICITVCLWLAGCAFNKEARSDKKANAVADKPAPDVQAKPLSYLGLMQVLPDALAHKGAQASARIACKAMFSRGIHAPYKRKPSSFWGTKEAWQHACRRLDTIAESDDLSRFYNELFCPYIVAPKEDGLFTGYYLPQISISAKKTNTYTIPVYGLPKGHTRKSTFPARSTIETKGITSAPVIAWTDDAVALFFLHVQGSGYGRYPDGSMITLAYAGKNNQPYTSIGSVMIKEGRMTRDEMNGRSLKKALYAMKSDVHDILRHNDSYVFFKKQQGERIQGAAGAHLTAQHAIAVDPAFLPYYLPILLTTTVTNNDAVKKPFTRFVHSLDTGSAIKGPKRADIFFGGGKEAEQLAYHQQFGGEMIIFTPRGSRNVCPNVSINTSFKPVKPRS